LILAGDLSFVAEGDAGFHPVTQWMRTSMLHTRASPIPGGFLSANPSDASLSLSDNQFSDAVRVYLGMPVRPDTVETPQCQTPSCDAPVYSVAAHDLNCSSMTGPRSSRHSAISFGLHRFFNKHSKSMSSKPVREPLVSTYLRIPAGELATQAKGVRADECLHLGERVLLLDYTVTSPPLTTRDKDAADSVALHGEARKATFYSSRFGSTRVGDTSVIPIALSALGRPSPRSLEAIYSVARHLGNNSDQQTAAIAQRIFQTLSVLLYRGNSGVLRSYRHVSRPHQ
jgi:hypothetical protein